MILADHLHYEVALTRTAFDNLKRYTLASQAARLKEKIAINRHEHSLVLKTMQGLQEYFLSHRGNKARKTQAHIHCSYKKLRLYLDAWKARYDRRVAHREKLHYM